MTAGPPRDLRLWLLVAAMLALLAALAGPTAAVSRPAYDLLLVVDITGSMNARDGTVNGRPASRLDAARAALRTLVARLPCGSRAGLGVFTERRSFLLFEPVETCANFAPIDGAIAALHWRMAWEGDSRIASGVDSALALAQELGASLVFLTDGHEAPPLPASGPPAFDAEAGAVSGILVGVGGTVPVPIPRFDDRGREIGFVRAEDVPHESRVGPPPADASGRPGWHPRNAPWGAVPEAGTEHLTEVRESHLRDLAQRTGLGYALLTGVDALEAAVRDTAAVRPIAAAVDLRPVPAAGALLALLALYGVVPLMERRRRSRRHAPRRSPTA
ncbi:vWA domain-containing protein [Azospirillum halopraeferens]|uniref:vWA domain-containing protein n=1 Tax=Azospirillum halopraeferens TaxID=34010 RepID=UPI000413D581|nr:vWA domain-containing protein [Azospirillum halopraeferens]